MNGLGHTWIPHRLCPNISPDIASLSSTTIIRGENAGTPVAVYNVSFLYFKIWLQIKEIWKSRISVMELTWDE